MPVQAVMGAWAYPPSSVMVSSTGVGVRLLGAASLAIVSAEDAAVPETHPSDLAVVLAEGRCTEERPGPVPFALFPTESRRVEIVIGG